MWELTRRHLYNYYSPIYRLMAVRKIESLVVKGKAIIDDKPETAIKDYIIYLKKVNRGEII